LEEEVFYETEIAGKRWNVSQTIKKKIFLAERKFGLIEYRIFSEFNLTTSLVALKISC